MSREANFRRFLGRHLVENHGADPELSPIVADILVRSTSFNEAGDLVVHDRFGLPTDANLDDLVGEFREAPGNSAFFVKPTGKLAHDGPRVLATVGGCAPVQGRSSADRVADAVANGNPWHRDSLNTTKQATVAGLDPELAARLINEAARAR